MILTAGTSGAVTRQDTRSSVQAKHAHPGAVPKIRRQGILVLAANGTAYDLDSRVANWDPLVAARWADPAVAT